MSSTVLPSRNRRASCAALVIAVALGAGWSRAQAASPPVASDTAPAVSGATGPFAENFPNLVLKTHEGKNVRFYDDLLKGKIVLINFMYATCEER